MDEPTPKRTWWRKRQWRVALAAWLLLPVAYPLGYGAWWYAAHRMWFEIRPPGLEPPAIFGPLQRATRDLPVQYRRPYLGFLYWCRQKGLEHRTAEEKRRFDQFQQRFDEWEARGDP